MSSFEDYAARRVLRKAAEAGVDIPPDLTGMLAGLGCASGYAAKRWAKENPGVETTPGCCWGDAIAGPEGCTCWVAVFDVEQEPLQIAAGADIAARTTMCVDCAYRPGSPEREDEFTEVALLDLHTEGELFWCHQGLRAPAWWEHPDGRTVPGSPDDYQPAQHKGVPYQVNGKPALLCAGWMARAFKAGTVGQ